MTAQALLVGYLSQFFCEKNSLDEELSMLRDNNESDKVIHSKEEEIDVAIRNAYLYAAGMLVAAVTLAILHAWNFYLAHKIGMICRLILTGAIYTKVIYLLGTFKLCNLTILFVY